MDTTTPPVSLKIPIAFYILLIAGTAAIPAALGVMQIAFPIAGAVFVFAAVGALALLFVGPIYTIITVIFTLLTFQTDRTYISNLTEEEKHTILQTDAAKFQTKNQLKTFAATIILTITAATALILHTIPSMNADDNNYSLTTTIWMAIGTILVITSIWFLFSNHRNIFDKHHRTAQKLAIEERAHNWKLILTSCGWTTIIWMLGGSASIFIFLL